MGEMEVPADALYGASTQRAVLNFPISGQPLPRRFIRALALIKQAAAEANAELGLLAGRRRGGDRRRRRRGRRRPPRRPLPDRRLPDRLRDVDEHEHERGRRDRSRRGALGGGRRVHPNDDVNKCQSSNDTIPTALQLSAAIAIERGAAAGARGAAGGARREGRRAVAGRQDGPDAPPGRDADPARPGVPGLRRAGRGVDPAGPGRAGRAARRAARRDRGRDRDQRPPGVRGAGRAPGCLR